MDWCIISLMVHNNITFWLARKKFKLEKWGHYPQPDRVLLCLTLCLRHHALMSIKLKQMTTGMSFNFIVTGCINPASKRTITRIRMCTPSFPRMSADSKLDQMASGTLSGLPQELFDIVCDVDSISSRSIEPSPRQTDAVQSILPFPVVREALLTHPVLT